MATGGRTPKLQDPGIRKALLNGIRLGMSYEKAAILAGITYQTFKTWMDKGKVANKGQYREFYDELKKVDAEGEAACIQKIQKAAQDGTWQAAAWILERRHPEDWGRKDKVDTTITHKEPLVIKGPDDGNKPN